MNTYFSTFFAGGGEFVEEFLRQDTNACVERVWDGLIEYKSSAPSQELARLGYFNNTYLELKSFAAAGCDDFWQKCLVYLRNAGDEVWEKLARESGERRLTYRLMFYDRNKPMAVDRRVLDMAEKYISDGQLVDRTRPGMEVAGMYRSEGTGFLGIRLTYHKDFGDVLRPGELRPEISQVLVRISQPQTNDVFLDPFSGYGAIVEARHKSGSYAKIISVDSESEKIKFLKRRFGSDQKIVIRQADATDLSWISEASVGRVVTDPPWGNFDRQIDVKDLYKRALGELGRIMVGGGILVMLSAAREEVEEAVKENENFELMKRWDILVSGRKASIYKVIRKK